MRERPLRILMIGTRLTPNGGMQRYIQNLLQNLDTRRYKIDLLATPVAPGAPSMEPALREAGVTIYYMPGEDKQRLFFYGGFLKQHRDYDLIHLHTTSKVNALACGIFRRRCPGAVLVAHAHTVYPPVTLAWRLAYGFYGRSVQYYLACSRAAGAFVFGPSVPDKPNFSVACNAVERDRFYPDPAARERLRRQYGIPPNARLAGFVGRYNHGKNLLFILEILACLHKKDPGFYLMLVGDGEDRPLVDERIAALGLTDRVVQVGVQSDVPAFMNAFDVFLLPSKFEGSPVTLVEAQACGLRSFASDHVPADSAVTGLVHFLPLDAPAQTWADAVDAETRCTPHPDVWPALAEAGYDLVTAARQMEHLYDQLTADQ